MKKVVAFVLAAAMSMSLVACGSSTASSAPAASAASQAASTPAADGKTVKVGMVTDVGGVNDKSFNQTTYDERLSFNSVKLEWIKVTDLTSQVVSKLTIVLLCYHHFLEAFQYFCCILWQRIDIFEVCQCNFLSL